MKLIMNACSFFYSSIKKKKELATFIKDKIQTDLLITNEIITLCLLNYIIFPTDHNFLYKIKMKHYFL